MSIYFIITKPYLSPLISRRSTTVCRARALPFWNKPFLHNIILFSASMGKPDDSAAAAAAASVRTAETLLRILPMALCLAALVIMLKNSQTNEYGSLSYSDLGAFRFLVHASGVCAGYSLLTAVAAAVPRPSTMLWAWAFFLLDQLLTYIILTAAAISTEVVYLAYKGDASVTWSESCGAYGGFCRKATASIALTFIVTLCYAALSLLSSYRLFTKYDAPLAYNTTPTTTSKRIEAATSTSTST